MKANAVFEGGGMRGIGIVGALNYFEARGYEWNCLAGTSSGALIAAFLASGYTARELKKILIETNFNKFLDRKKIQKIPLLGTALAFISENGIYEGDYLENWIKERLFSKGVRTFADLSSDGQCKLKIVTSDITRKERIVLPDDLNKYGFHPSEFEISKAIRMSISIPFYFKPVLLTHKFGKSIFVDGAITCNFPLHVFDTEDIPSYPTFGFKFSLPNEQNPNEVKKNPLSLLLDITSTMCRESDAEYEKAENVARTVLIPCLGVESKQFNLSKEKKLQLYKSGYRSAMEFLDHWNFESYIRTYASQNSASIAK